MHIYYVTMKCGSDQWLETVFAHDAADAIEQAELRHYDVKAIKAWRAVK